MIKPISSDHRKTKIRDCSKLTKLDCSHLIKMERNRVYRTYQGGKILEKFLGNNEGVDDHFPEEWISSITLASGSVTEEGLSKFLVRGEQYTLKSLIEQYPDEMLGHAHREKYGTDMGVLVKLLDAAERLTIQVHPNDFTARRLFQSPFGKTEAWYILDTRDSLLEKPYILLGFQPEITQEKWMNLFEEQDIQGMKAALHRFEVEVGQMYLVPAGVPHAIGKGCFILEIQQSTDYTIRVEKTTPRGMAIPDFLCHQGLGFQTMFECFAYEGMEKEQIRKRCLIPKQTIRTENENYIEELIGYHNTSCFQLQKVVVETTLTYQAPERFCSEYHLSRTVKRCLGKNASEMRMKNEALNVPEKGVITYNPYITRKTVYA